MKLELFAGLTLLARLAAPPDATTCPALVGADAEWPSDDEGTRRLSRDVDVDGDGRPDHFEGESSSGSGFGSTKLSVQLTSSGQRIEIESESSFYSMTDSIDIPPKLLEPSNACALAVVEKTLFGGVVDRPDPSLEWLLTPDDRKTIQWVPGPPVLPGRTTLRAGEAWIFYRGWHHAGPGGDAPPREVARQGERVLLATPHGVILTDPQRTRHAWIYVSAGGGDNKVRLPSVRGASVEGNTAVIRLEQGARPEGHAVVRVDLLTGRLLGTAAERRRKD